MSMERWNPFREMETMRNWMDRFFDENFGQRGSTSQWSGHWTPAVDLVETDQGYELRTSVPGFKPEDIQLEVDRDLVTIRGEMKPPQTEQRQGNYLYRERRSGSFYRQVRLPQPVESDKVQAYLENGELRLELPRSTQAATRRVQVQSSGQNYGAIASGTGANQPAMSAPAGQTRSGGFNQVRVNQEVFGSDNQRIGKVKEVRANEFLVDRSMQRDLWVPFRAIQNVEAERVLLNLPASQVDNQGWSTPPLSGESGYSPAQPS